MELKKNTSMIVETTRETKGIQNQLENLRDQTEQLLGAAIELEKRLDSVLLPPCETNSEDAEAETKKETRSPMAEIIQDITNRLTLTYNQLVRILDHLDL